MGKISAPIKTTRGLQMTPEDSAYRHIDIYRVDSEIEGKDV